ncbi:uncharacterized protein P174DRAFT_113773 [Aspergillus novofumigatus IBT 16806]|uniref:Uncharacterized protein n=1 Tax=Aspergillus novofumigatus (strain IBT 16806) TaxID=1392255 RepID=A0A2I1CJ27_ASPN1|nr:uncharacterized protein P174DRAFT_113773 [Aspergillus novofumigatus IBT 16806]PKX97597.1 hypothetical protein P174DRAFT_113773 [Aspergillus novofumigatus IBT 16806]
MMIKVLLEVYYVFPPHSLLVTPTNPANCTRIPTRIALGCPPSHSSNAHKDRLVGLHRGSA